MIVESSCSFVIEIISCANHSRPDLWDDENRSVKQIEYREYDIYNT